MRIVDSQWMNQAESWFFEHSGLEIDTVIESVGVHCSQSLLKLVDCKSYQRIVFLVGKGKNAADALAMARHLSRLGLYLDVLLFFENRQLSIHLKKQIKACKIFPIQFSWIRSLAQMKSFLKKLDRPVVWVDGLFGLGQRLPLPKLIQDILNQVNLRDDLRVSIDVPTGLDADGVNFEYRPIFKSDITLTVQYPKIGFYLARLRPLIGKLALIRPGFSFEQFEAKSQYRLIHPRMFQTQETQSLDYLHKNQRGKVGVIAGSFKYMGALHLCVSSILAAGAGMVRAFIDEEIRSLAYAQKAKELIIESWPDTQLELLLGQDVLILGPGLEVCEGNSLKLKYLIANYKGILIIDASGLRLLKDLNLDLADRSLRPLEQKLILTPHFGEFQYLMSNQNLKNDKASIDLMLQISQSWDVHLIVKNPISYLATPKANLYVLDAANSAMAKGGSGDVLAGLLGGLLAQAKNQSKSLSYTLAQGLFIHSQAGNLGRRDLGHFSMLPSDLIRYYPKVFKALNKEKI